MGDEVQALKAGILEVGDIFVINKADRDGADKTVREIEVMLEMQTYSENTWKPTVFKTQAIHDEGIPEFVEGIEKHRSFLFEGKQINRHIEERLRQKFLDELQNMLMKEVLERIEKDNPLNTIIKSLVDKTKDPYSQVENILKKVLK
jgi:LAO/AO transport system kinase